jgi:hypothetical protein
MTYMKSGWEALKYKEGRLKSEREAAPAMQDGEWLLVNTVSTNLH